MTFRLTAPSLRPGLLRRAERLDEGGEVFFVDVADRDVSQVRIRPAGDMKAVDGLDPAGARAATSSGSSVTAIRCSRLR